MVIVSFVLKEQGYGNRERFNSGFDMVAITNSTLKVVGLWQS
ncbi:hypothetical protein VCRA2126E14_20183 [Vibrio crassostreae]|nr:hypothetical protein VCRA2110O2_20184 [Vibrio crassostreae]CAK3501486.1 hypothetical protein VCRA2126E14_20183 [Vibrio crassostreae]